MAWKAPMGPGNFRTARFEAGGPQERRLKELRGSFAARGPFLRSEGGGMCAAKNTAQL